MNSKYDRLGSWLSYSPENQWIASFKQIEIILGFNLPPTARTRQEWWSNEDPSTTSHVQCKSWVISGWKTTKIDLEKEIVKFCRNVV